MTIDAGWARYVDLYSGSLHRSELEEVIDSLRDGDFTRAEQLCESLLDESGGVDASIWAMLGLYYLVKKDLENARVAIDRAMELDPESTLTMNVAGDFASFASDFENAEQFYLMSLQKDPDQLHPRVVLGNRYIAYERYEEAVDVLLSVLYDYPDKEDVWIQLRAAMGSLTDKKREEKVARSLIGQFPDNYHALCMMGATLLRQERAREALKYCKRAIEQRKNDDLLWTLYGSVLNMLGKPKAALICHKKAVQFNSGDPKTLASLSLAYFMAGDLKQAMRVADKVIAIAPEEAVELVGFLEEWEEEHADRKKKTKRKRKARARR